MDQTLHTMHALALCATLLIWLPLIDLDGRVRYTGADNDRDRILQNIGGVVPTNIRIEQLP